MRFAVRAFPSPACASVEWAWPASRSGFAPRACSRRSCRSLAREIADRILDPGRHPRSIAAEARSRAWLRVERKPRRPRSVSTDVCNPQDLFSTTSPVSRCTPNRIPRDSGIAGSRRRSASAIRALVTRYFSRIHAARRASDVRPSCRGERSGRAPRPRIARAASRSSAAPRERVAVPSTPDVFHPDARSALSREEGAPKLLQCFNRPSGTSRCLRSPRPPKRAATFSVAGSAQPKPAASLWLGLAREPRLRPRRRAGGMLLEVRRCRSPLALRRGHPDAPVAAAQPSKAGSAFASTPRPRSSRDDRAPSIADPPSSPRSGEREASLPRSQVP